MSCPGRAASRHYRRSPFLTLRWEDQDLVLINCDTLRRFRVDERLMTALRTLSNWTSIEEVEASGFAADARDLERLVSLGVVEASTSASSGDGSPYWTSFELAVQRLQSGGALDRPAGPSERNPPPPTFKPPPDGPAKSLPTPPDLPGGFAEVLGKRRTQRTYSNRPLSLDALSGVLHHSARVLSSSHDEALGERAWRPFPSGGARSELEIYVVASDVTGLSAGAHYYDARAHRLVQLRERDRHQDRLNRWLQGATGGALNRDPQAVLLVTAVFARVMWKYHGIGLGLIYRNVGCLYQTLYLVAAALGLAPCAIGAGEESANARWLGLDPSIESQVGCFLLGTQGGSGA